MILCEGCGKWGHGTFAQSQFLANGSSCAARIKRALTTNSATRPRSSGRRKMLISVSRPSRRVPLLHDKPPALLVAEIKFRHGSGLGRLLIRRLNGPEVLPALSDDRDAPASQLGGGGLLSPGFHVASMLP